MQDAEGRAAMVDPRNVRARERAAVHKTRYRGLSYRQRNGSQRTYLGYIPRPRSRQVGGHHGARSAFGSSTAWFGQLSRA
jgi:hypothetical protein